MDSSRLTGSLKAAILVKALGPNTANLIINRLSDDETKLVNKLQGQLGKVPAKLVGNIISEFIEKTTRKSPDGKSSAGKEDKDPEKDENRESSTLKAIQSLKPEQLIDLIKDEHPQTIALIISHVKYNIASEVLENLPDSKKSDVALRIANLEKIGSEMVDEIDKVFEEILSNNEQSAVQEAGGVNHLAEILNQIEQTSSEQIIEEIEENNPELAEEIKQMMFIFDDIVMVDNKGLQKVLRSVDAQELAIALKAATEEVKVKIFQNMSERAADILKEEMEVSGAVKMKDVTDAQNKITKIIQEMERKGELIIAGRGGEQYI